MQTAIRWAIMVRNAYHHTEAMHGQTQQEFLRTAKEQLGATWDELATASGINPRALKTYRMPEISKDYRSLPDLARAAVVRLLENRRSGLKKDTRRGTCGVP
ncbi:MAG: hypothetical protein ACRYHA_32525 [Janthinobacterium lividum]